jgi:hypothetical protein
VRALRLLRERTNPALWLQMETPVTFGAHDAAHGRRRRLFARGKRTAVVLGKTFGVLALIATGVWAAVATGRPAVGTIVAATLIFFIARERRSR